MKKIGIIGCGWLGLHIAKHLAPKNKIYTTTTSERKKTELVAMGYNSVAIQFWDHKIFQEYRYWKVLNNLDSIIITIPFSKRASIKLLQNQFENISLFIDSFEKQLFLMSSIGIYPQIQMKISEDTLSEEHLNSSILFIERFITEKFPQANILRLGGLMGGNRIFSNYKSSNLHQVVNHIHYKDICLIIEKMISKNVHSKIYNVVAPLHPTKQEIIDYQKGISTINDHQEYGRIILSNLLQKDLNYLYLHPDPKEFN